MTSSEIRSRFLKFFEKRGHAILPSASLVPENDPSVLFNTAGMQPLVPYLMGQPHPLGQRLASCQKCVRTGDLDDIGDNRHFSFFEMLGNWSLGDYFKDKAIEYSYLFLTNGEDEEEGDKGLGLVIKKERLYVTVFSGDEYSPRDTESFEIWRKLGIPENRIYFLGAEDNWWGAGDTGPCGPCTEMFYDMEGNVGDLSQEEFVQAIKSERVIEIWNDVFMTYNKQVKDEFRGEYENLKSTGESIPSHFYFLTNLPNKNVDTGAGLERLTAVMQGKKTAYETDLFEKIFSNIVLKDSLIDEKSKKIIADHTRTAVFMIVDGIYPSNTSQGYILRRLLRRAIYKSSGKSAGISILRPISNEVVKTYQEVYPEILEKLELIKNVIEEEELKFIRTIKNIDNIFNEIKKIKETIDYVKRDPINSHLLEIGKQTRDYYFKNSEKFILNGKAVFNIYQSHGAPIDLLKDFANENGLVIDVEDFEKRLKEHQELSRTSSAGMFKGGLANHNEKTIRLHTAHHLLLAALQTVVDPNIKQRGSNITEERLRIDFSFDRKVTPEELQKVEDLVNEKIKAELPVIRKEMPREEAEKIGAQMEFGAKYPDMVSVYMIGGESSDAFSKEFCGGPHVTNTKEIGVFKIQKEEASSQGVRRIKAVLV